MGAIPYDLPGEKTREKDGEKKKKKKKSHSSDGVFYGSFHVLLTWYKFGT